jgi:hypothetical protein
VIFAAPDGSFSLASMFSAARVIGTREEYTDELFPSAPLPVQRWRICNAELSRWPLRTKKPIFVGAHEKPEYLAGAWPIAMDW